MAGLAGPPPACAPWLTHGPQVRTGPRSWHTRRRGGPTSPNTSTPRARRRVHAGRLDATRRRRATPASGASPDGRRLRNGDGAGCDSHHPTGQDGERLWPRPAVARAGSNDPVGKDARPVPLEAGVRVPSSGPGGEHVLPRHVHHRRGPSRPESSQAGECGRPRLCDPESDDRPRPTRVISPRPVRILSVGLVRTRHDSCNTACAGKARSRGTRCRDVIFETLFETLWVSNPIRPRSAASRNRGMRGPGVTQGAKRSQGARRPRD